MTDNTNHHDNEAGPEARDRVIGTPSAADGEGPADTGTEPHRRHEGPYSAEETHTRTEEMQRKGEKGAALWFLLAFFSGIGFLVSYFLFSPEPDAARSITDPGTAQIANMAMGGTITLALFAIGAGMTVWARQVMPHYEVGTPYDELPSSPEEKGSFSEFFMRGGEESGITKRPLMRRTLLLAMVPLGLAPIVLLRDTGPLPGEELRTTLWEDGMRMVVEGTEREILATDLQNGSMISALPKPHDAEHGLSLNEQADTVVLLIKMAPSEFSPGMTEQQLDWTHNGIIAYSKICTHVGCPAALYEQTTHRILCPCHQSTFDAANGAEVVFGPAHRPLPQLPVRVDDEGYLVAAGDFSAPVGPTFWSAGRGE
ncbi:ubiquinol-cytochrome c reductase iron-sulfur subunit [Spinactinospora alkalitolerans]|uniref:Cytochrome bc1 complex Rieske iron-sulfur subunit n=1 Tax=Spinactinospora alkalitolerans TaxID=687207 RepID=A0A852U177_9ACTN|nr:Rieske 2Fe-2S domain-containing protein [Spinactinospora alkalitolerans]NYE48743.1 ubiquinol-cytochrome c reductase iron-sulfur subunit [Spinactinospora alkalitolerans]